MLKALKNFKDFKFDYKNAEAFTKDMIIPQTLAINVGCMAAGLIFGGVPVAARMVIPAIRNLAVSIGAGYLASGVVGGLIDVADKIDDERKAEKQEHAANEESASGSTTEQSATEPTVK